MINVRNCISRGERDDYSYFNPERLVEMRVSDIWRKYAAKFAADDFPGLKLFPQRRRRSNSSDGSASDEDDDEDHVGDWLNNAEVK